MTSDRHATYKRVLEDAGILRPQITSHAMTVASYSPHTSRFAQSTRVTISHLGPPLDAQQPRHIRAVVALVWPYSSSTRVLSLLLAEPDVRLRKGKGQVKVTFQGPSAEAVAKGHVSIGDTVQLGLEGVQWIRSSEHVSTPGKKIEWDLVFNGKADLDVKRESQIVATIKVDRPSQPSTTVDPSEIQHLESTHHGSGPQLYLHDINSWSSPIFVKEKRLSSSSFFDASLDPFTDDDGFIVGKGRKRTKFARHSESWRLVDRTPSPEKEPVDLRLGDIKNSTETATLRSRLWSSSNDVEVVDEQVVDAAPFPSTAADTSTVAGNSQPLAQLPESPCAEVAPQAADAADRSHSPLHSIGQMQPPTTPPRRVPHISDMVTGSGARKHVHSSVRSDLETPRLGPLPSPGLPLVSPLIRQAGTSLGYFLDLSESRSELDSSGDHQQSMAGLELRLASSSEPALSTGVEQVSLLYPAEAEKPRASEPEATVRNPISEPSLPRQVLSPQIDQHTQPIGWTSFPGGVQQAHIIPHEQEQAPTNAEDLDFEFLRTSPMEANDNGQDSWRFPDTSAGAVVTPDASKDSRPLELVQAFGRSEDLPGLATDAVPQNDTTRIGVPRDIGGSNTATPYDGMATQNEDVDPTSGVALDLYSRVPIDPSLFNSPDVATDIVASGTEGTEARVELPNQVTDSRPWADKLDVSAVEAESHRLYTAPPFPFQQYWHRRPSSLRSRRSSQYTSFDGVSDEVSVDEPSEAKDIPEGLHWPETPDQYRRSDNSSESSRRAQDSNLALSPALTDEPRRQTTEMLCKDDELLVIQAAGESQSLVVLNSSDKDATSSGQPKGPAINSITSSSTGLTEDVWELRAIEVDDVQTEDLISTDKIRKPQAGHTEDSVPPPSPAHDEPAGSTNDIMAVGKKEQIETEMTPANCQDLSKEPSKALTESINYIRPLEESVTEKLSNQLVTPENTQEHAGNAQLQDQAAEIWREASLPPTPQNTQEHTDFLQPTVELPIPADAAVEVQQAPEMTLPTGVDEMRERRRSPRLSRKFPPSQEVTEVVSPYFAPRRTSRMPVQDLLAEPPKPLVMEQSTVAASCTTPQTGNEEKLSDNAVLDEEAASGSLSLAPPSTSLTTSLSYYPRLSLLQDHFSHLVDVLALSTTSSTKPQRAKLGPRDWHTTLRLTDPSLEGQHIITAQIFRTYKTALPKVQRGNIVLLRSFKVQSQNRNFTLLSTECSAWTAFSVRTEEGGKFSDVEAVVAGPPVEYGAEEKGYVLELKKWWDAEGEDRHPVQKQADRSTRIVPAKSNGVGITTNHKLRDGTVYHDRKDSDEQAGVSGPYHEPRDGTLYKDDMSGEASNSSPKVRDAHDQSGGSAHLHKLRDGTVYQDETPSRPLRSRPKTSSAGTTKALDDDNNAKIGDESSPANENQHTSQELVSTDVEVQAESDSGEESPTDAAVSSQIYHELRNGRRYADPTPALGGTKELQQEKGQDQDESIVHELRDGVTYIDE